MPRKKKTIETGNIEQEQPKPKQEQPKQKQEQEQPKRPESWGRRHL